MGLYPHIRKQSGIQTGTYKISKNKVILNVFNDGEITFEYDKKTNSLSTNTADIVYVKVPLNDELLALSKQEPDAWFQSGEDGLKYISSDKNSTLIEITSNDYRLLAYGIDKLTIDNAIQNNSQLGWYCIGIDRA